MVCGCPARVTTPILRAKHQGCCWRMQKQAKSSSRTVSKSAQKSSRCRSIGIKFKQQYIFVADFYSPRIDCKSGCYNVTMLQCTMEHNAEVSDDQVIFCARECSNLTKPHQDHQCLSVQVITLTVAKEIRAPLKRKGSNQRQKINV